MKGVIKSERLKRDTMNEKDEQKRIDELMKRAKKINEACIVHEIEIVHAIAINKMQDDWRQKHWT